MTRNRRGTRWGAALLLPACMLCAVYRLQAQTTSSVALTGQVNSQEERMMEGVLVSAQREGSVVTVTVVSDAQGRFSFPRARLEPGRYILRIRAVGYDLDSPGSVEVTTNKTAQLNLILRKTQNPAAQLTSAEWLWSAPGKEHKTPLLECTGCHTLERVFRSHDNAGELTKVVQRMATYYEGTVPERPQLTRPAPQVPRQIISSADVEYLSTVNLSSASQWPYPLKGFPRPKGKATRVIITQYDLPRKTAMPHDVVPDSDGIVWYSDHSQQFLGRLDPRTAEVAEYALPVLKPGIPTGLHFLKIAPDGNVWLTMGAQGAIADFDPKTKKFRTWNLPAGPGRDPNPSAYPLLLDNFTVDGKMWVGEFMSKRIERLDLHSGEWESELIDPFREIAGNSAVRHSFYDIFADSHHNVYLTDISSNLIGKIDAQTKETTFYPTPTANSGPRRGHMDNQGRLWFGENRGNRIAVFDTNNNKFQEWEVPTPFSAPYDVVLDKNGYAWTGGMATDRVVRLNTKTGEIVEYVLPRRTNIRRVEVDNSATPVTFWVGDNHGASIIKLEPME